MIIPCCTDNRSGALKASSGHQRLKGKMGPSFVATGDCESSTICCLAKICKQSRARFPEKGFETHFQSGDFEIETDHGVAAQVKAP